MPEVVGVGVLDVRPDELVGGDGVDFEATAEACDPVGRPYQGSGAPLPCSPRTCDGSGHWSA